MIDCDPQCNLTGTVLGEFDGDSYPYESDDPKKPRNIREAVAPAFDSRPYPISSVELAPVEQRENLLLLPGHVALAEYESQLAVSHELSNTLSALQNIPGALRHAINVTADANKIDVGIVDMSPSLGALNQNIFMTCDAFIIPMAPDIFSSMALRSLARVLPKWSEWAHKAADNSILRDADYPFPEPSPMYLGSTVQNYRKRARGDEEAKPTKAFQAWFDKLRCVKESHLLTALDKSKMLLPEQVYIDAEANPKEFFLEVSSFDSLVAYAQEVAKPVFALDTKSDIGSSGHVADQQRIKINDVEIQYRSASEKILNLLSSV